MIIGIFIITAILITILCYGFYWIGYRAAIKNAENIPDHAIKNAVAIVKHDDRIIECNGMMIPMQCEKCRFGRVNGNNVECFVPDYDGVPTMGLKR